MLNLLLGIYSTNVAHLGFYALFDSAIYGHRNTSAKSIYSWTDRIPVNFIGEASLNPPRQTIS